MFSLKKLFLLPALAAIHSTVAYRLTSSRLMMSATPVSYKVGFMFPGQGAQAVGMAGPLCESVPAAKALFDKASGILGYDLLAKCVNGPKEELDSTVIAQVAIFVSSMAALEKLKVEDPAAVDTCTVAMGLSLGEYSALCFAGAFSFEDGVKLTKARGEAMQAAADASSSGMVAVIGLDIPTVEKICAEATAKSGKPVSIANYLVDGNYAVSGAKEACQAVQEIAPTMGARMAVPLAVAGAFHTSFMEPAVERLKKVLAEVDIKTPRIPVISNVDAKPHYDPQEIRDILAKQVTNPVQWETIITTMVKSPDFQKAYELGPGTVCRGIVKRFGKKLEVVNVQA
jgi:[acyl-carrier-protein] S-malonyltransferase